MKLSPQIVDIILHADNKALATTGPHGINVVPVSTVRIVGDNILLMNYFLKKTLDNILEQPHIALVCWKGFDGYQIKGTVEYSESGDAFEEARTWVEKNLKNRVLKGLIILKPENIYDISP